MLGFIEEAKSEGAKLITGGGSPPSVDKGYFVQPTVFEVEPSERPRFDAHDRFHARLLLHRVPAAACADTRPLLALICVAVADHSIWKDEVFGPVLGVKSFSTEEEAIALANDTSYGLAANVFSKDDDRGNRVDVNFRRITFELDELFGKKVRARSRLSRRIRFRFARRSPRAPRRLARRSGCARCSCRIRTPTPRSRRTT